jgi:predicted metal-dependent phosphoesterase TrpH
MILDLHNHSIASDDGRAKVENYCQWIRKRALPLDGFVLSEHRQFDAASDYAALADEYGLVILKASEVETDYGHVLVFGVNEAMQRAFDFARIDLPLGVVVREADRCGGIAVPCHPGRPRVGMCAHVAEKGPVEGVRVIETRNGGSRASEDEAALRLAEERGYLGVGGSDAHIVSHIGRCATRFPAPVKSAGELVEALRAGEFEAVKWKSTSTS